MHRVRCTSCRKTVAYSAKATALRNEVFCSDWCANEPVVGPQEVRNDLWRLLVANGRSPASIARQWSVAHSLVYKTLRR